MLKFFCPLQSTLALFGPHWSYSVHISPIFVHFSLIQSTLVLDPFCPHWSFWYILSTSVQFVYFSLVWSILLTLVLICSFNLIQSILVLFGLLQSHLILLVPIWSIQTTSVHFDPLRSIFVHVHNGKRHVWVERTYSKYKFIIKKI